MTVEWVAQQKKVFTKWVNMHLNKKDIKVENLTEDFCDGINLCALMELLSHKPLPHKPSTKTTTQYMRCQNLNIGFKLISSEGIKLVGVGAEDLEAKNEKMLLGLIWTLIQFYQISLKGKSGASNSGGKQGSKDVLMGWVKAHLQTIPGVVVKDFHQSWQDGLAFCALVKRALPDSIDFSSLKGGSRIDNLNLAFTMAERELGIPKLLDAEDIANSDKPDEQSIMTYVSLFPEVYESRGIPTPDIAEGSPRKEVARPPPPLPVIVEDTSKVNDMEAEIAKLKLLLNSAEKRVEETEVTFKDQLAANELSSTKMKKDLQELQDALAAHEKHRCPDVAGVESEIEHMKTCTKTKEDEISKLKEMLKNLQEQETMQAEDRKKLADQLAGEKESRSQLQEELSVLQQKLDKAREEQALAGSEKERELRDLCEKLENEKEQEHKILERERRDSSAAISELKALCESLQKEKEAEGQVRARERRDSNAAISELKGLCEKLEKEKEIEGRTRRDSVAELDSLSKEVIQLRTEQRRNSEQYEEEIQRLKQRVAEAESEKKTVTKSGSLSKATGFVFGHQNRGRKYSVTGQATLLHEATKAGDFEMVTHLLESGFPVDARDAYGNSPLHIVSEQGNDNAVTLLLSYKADPNATNNGGFTPLHYASRAGHAIIVTQLLERKVDVNAKNNEGDTSLLLATEQMHTEVVKILLAAGANVKLAKAENGWGPLYTTCYHGNADCAELIIAAGAEVDSVTIKGWTPLFAAAANGHLEVVKRLREKHGANVNMLDYQMTTPLFHSVLENRKEIAEYLLDNGADVNAGGAEGWRPLHAAVYNDSLAMVELLMKNNPNLNVQCKELNMYTPLQLAIASTKPVPDLITCLLQGGADTNITAQSGSTALHIAAHYGHEAIVKMLVKEGAQLTLKNSKGKTPVRIAANYGYKGIVEYLAHKQGIKEPSLKNKTPKFKSSQKPEIPTAH